MRAKNWSPVSLTWLACLTLLPLAACDDGGGRGGGGGGGGGGEGEGEGEGEQQELQPLSAEQAKAATLTNLQVNLDTAADAVGFAAQSQLADSLATLGEDDEASSELQPRIAEEAADAGQEMKDNIDEAVNWLRENVFTQAEASDDTSVTYLLGRTVCEKIVDSGDCASDGSSVPEIEGRPAEDSEEYEDCYSEEERQQEVTDCVDFLAEVPMRLRVTSAVEGDVDLTLLVGEAKLETITLEVHRQSLAVQVDLAACKAALQLILDQAGEDGEEVQLPETLEGVLRLQLAVDGAKKVTLTSRIVSTVRVTMTTEDASFSMSMAPSTATLTADGEARTVAGTFQAGAIDLSLPLQTVVDSYYEERESAEPDPMGSGDSASSEDSTPAPVAPGQLNIHIAGLSGGTQFSEEATGEELKLTGLGLGAGTSYVKLDQTTLFSLDLNPSSGRVFDLTITPESQGFDEYGDEEILPKLAFAPGFDLSLAFKLAAVANYFQDVPSFLLDETWQLVLDGAAAPTMQILDQETETLSFGVKMLAGKLTMSSTAPVDDVVIEQGMCLASPIEEDEQDFESASGSDEGPSHPFSELQSATCP